MEYPVDLNTFKNIDPNTIYREGSLTFVYTHSGELWTKPFPTDHISLIMDDDEIFSDVFDDPIYFNLTEKEKLNLAKDREEQCRHAIVGRFIHYHGDIIVAIWNSFSHPLFQPFIKTLSESYPQLSEFPVIVVGKDQNPQLLSDLLGHKKKEFKQFLTTIAPSSEKVYTINGRVYTIKNLGDLRKDAHSQSWRRQEVSSVLCHPDMKKYPELAAYIPAWCEPIQQKKPHRSDWIRASGLSYENQKLYFKGWLNEQNL